MPHYLDGWHDSEVVDCLDETVCLMWDAKVLYDELCPELQSYWRKIFYQKKVGRPKKLCVNTLKKR